MNLGTSDLIALAAIGVALLSALYARRAAGHAQRANEIAVQIALRPSRLALFTSIVEFLHFCSTYRTLQSIGQVKGSADLVTRLDRFKWEIAQHGPIEMPKVEDLIQETNNKAWQLQRLSDRLGGPDPKPLDSAFPTAEENLDGLMDWFALQEKGVPTLFEPYLKITQAPGPVR
jgi:hypothetical protein